MSAPGASPDLPVIDIAPLIDGSDEAAVARRLGAACRDRGFFSVVGHGVADGLRQAVL